MNSIPRAIRRAGFVAITAFLGLPAANAIDIAGSLEVSLDATNYTNGGNWTNTGALTGDFTPFNTPKRENVWGHEAVLFDGSGDAFRGPIVTALAGNSARSVEVWAFQGQIKNEETLVSWGRRGGGDGTNTSFLWGADREWGAHGGWGQPADLGWNPTPGNNNNPGGGTNDLTNVPVAGQWRLLTYTYDPAVSGGTLSVYADGVLKNTQSGVVLNTHSGYNMVIGSQNHNTGTPGITTPDNVFLSGAIGRVRVHSGVLSPTSVQTNYLQEAAEFATSQSAAFLTTGPAHRYTFSNLASGADGTVVPDIVGSAHAVVRGAGAAPQGTTGINLPGGTPDVAAYVDLPNGLLSSRTNITLETWMTAESVQNWSRVMDFGSTNLGELNGPTPGGYAGSNYVMLSAFNGTGLDQRFEHVGGTSENLRVDGDVNNPRYGISRDAALSAIIGQEQHVVFTFDDAANEWRYYRNGVLMEVISDITSLSSIPDVNNWLGRSQYSGDFNTDGIYNEFRIYDYALTPAQIAGNFAVGADVVNIPEPGSISLLGIAAAAVLGRRRRREQS